MASLIACCTPCLPHTLLAAHGQDVQQGRPCDLLAMSVCCAGVLHPGRYMTQKLSLLMVE